MEGLTTRTPKPMLRVGGKPLLEHVVDRLGEAGIDQFLVVTGYLGEQIREHFRGYGAPIQFREQTEVNGTARAALLARDFVADGPFLLTFGDILAGAGDYRGMIDLLDAATAAVLGVKHCDDPYRGAAVYESGGVVQRIVEKPPRGTSTTPWNSAGLYTFQPRLFDELERVPLSPRGEYELTGAVEQLVASGALVRMWAVREEWMDVGRPEDLARAQELLRNQGPMVS